MGSHRITLVRGDVIALGAPRRVAVGDHVTRAAEEVGVLRSQVTAGPGAVDLLLQLLEEPDWRHGQRWTSADDR